MYHLYYYSSPYPKVVVSYADRKTIQYAIDNKCLVSCKCFDEINGFHFLYANPKNLEVCSPKIE